MGNPKISVCIPVYNGEAFLKQCMESVLSQGFSDFEIVVVDDCSTDGSPKIIDDFKNKDKRIKVFRNGSNIGLVNNWNKCIALSSGEWIKFVFQDDYLADESLSVYADYILKESSVHFFVSARKYILPENTSPEYDSYYNAYLPSMMQNLIEGNRQQITAARIAKATVKYLGVNFIGEPTNFIFRKSLVDKHGYFNNHFDQLCDLEFAVRMGSVHGLYFIPSVLTFFRIHERSASSENAANKKYRLSNLEPVKLAHVFLYSPQYACFRDSLGKSSLAKLRLYFKLRGYEAAVNSKISTGNQDDFNKAASHFPEMVKAEKGSPIIRLLYKYLQLRRRKQK